MPRPPAFSDADATYAAIVAALEEVGDDRAVEFLSRLTLLLAGQVSDHQAIVALIGKAREGFSQPNQR